VLIIARDMMGDLVNTTGAVAVLRESFPETEFTIEGGAAIEDLFWEMARQFRPRGGGLMARFQRIRRLRRGKFEACLILDDGHSHARIARLAGIPIICGVHRGKPELFSESIPFDEAGHDLFDSLRGVLALVGLPNADVKPRLALRDSDIEAGETHFKKLGEPQVLLHVGASDYRKNWPDERWREFISTIKNHYRLAAVAGPGEDAARFGIPSPSDGPKLLAYAALMGLVERVVTPDTGAAHLAAAMGVPTTVLYGPTDPARFHPWDNGNQELIRRETACVHYGHGCSFKENGRCPQTCMRAISAKDAVRE